MKIRHDLLNTLRYAVYVIPVGTQHDIWVYWGLIRIVYSRETWGGIQLVMCPSTLSALGYQFLGLSVFEDIVDKIPRKMLHIEEMNTPIPLYWLGTHAEVV